MSLPFQEFDMVRKALFAVALAALGTGCMPGNNGIWLVFIPPMPDADCTLSADHNFVGADVPEEVDDSEWTETESYQASAGTGFAQIFDVGGGEEKKVMVFDGLTYLGHRESGVWLFTWTNFEDSSESTVHETGYEYGENSHVELTTTIEMDFSGNTATGTIDLDIMLTQGFTESDTWNADATGVWGGQIPAYAYLEDASGSSVYNGENEADCTGDPCDLTIIQDCTQSGSLEARETHYDEDAFYGIQDAGTNPGLDY